MLYIFDLGNVIVDIDFNRVLGAWSDLTRIPLASLKKSFHMGEAFHQHERGEISDEAFAEALYDYFVERCRQQEMNTQTGRFAADMQVSLVNDGPVTFWLQV